MHAFHVQLTITLGDDTAKALAGLLGPVLGEAAIPASDADEAREARLRASQHALFAGQQPPDDQGLLIDSKQAARLLKVSERTLWRMHHTGEMPPPIRIGRAVRWSVEALTKWVAEGCPAPRR
jgi:excisionase family DNA binding protein